MADTQTDTKLKPESNVKKKTRGPTKQTKFPLPASHTSFDYHIKVLKGLSVASNKGTNFTLFSEVAPIAGIHHDTVSKVLKFFYDISIIDRDKRGSYKPKPEVIDFFNELEWGESVAGKHFGKLIAKTWFGEYTLQLFKMNKELSKEGLIKNLGRYSLVDQSNHAELLIIIKFLEYGQIIKTDEKSGNYHLISDIDPSAKIESSTKSVDPSQKSEEEMSISSVKKEMAPHAPSENELTDRYNIADEVLREQQGAIQLHEGFFSIQFNVSINEDTDVEKIREKILRLKQILQ